MMPQEYHYQDVDPRLPNAFVKGYVHRANLRCPSCDGRGQKEGIPGGIVYLYTCPVCEGRGAYEVGCGGTAEFDLNYGLAYCLSEQTFVPRVEVTQEAADAET